MVKSQARVIVLSGTEKGLEGGWRLCFQLCRYEYNDEFGTEENGYRFIWKRPNGNLQGARGQARIPSIADAMELMSVAMREGWGNYVGSDVGYGYEGDS